MGKLGGRAVTTCRHLTESEGLLLAGGATQIEMCARMRKRMEDVSCQLKICFLHFLWIFKFSDGLGKKKCSWSEKEEFNIRDIHVADDVNI